MSSSVGGEAVSVPAALLRVRSRSGSLSRGVAVLSTSPPGTSPTVVAPPPLPPPAAAAAATTSTATQPQPLPYGSPSTPTPSPSSPAQQVAAALRGGSIASSNPNANAGPQQQQQPQPRSVVVVECYHSCDINVPLAVKVCSVDGIASVLRRESLEMDEQPFLRQARVQSGPFSDVYVTISLEDQGIPLLPFVVQTTHKPFSSLFKWDEWITLPIQYQDIPETATLVFVLWDVESPRRAHPVGHASLPLFGKKKLLKKGHHRLVLSDSSTKTHEHPQIELEQNGPTPSHQVEVLPHEQQMRLEAERLDRLTKKYVRGKVPKLEWLDGFSLKQIEEIKKHHEAELVLFIQLPEFQLPVIYHSLTYRNMEAVPAKATPTRVRPRVLTPATPPLPLPSSVADNIILINDPECGKPNLVESKHFQLTKRFHRRTPNKDMKPSVAESRELTKIMKYPPTKELSVEDRDLLWKFSIHLTKNKKALTKFLSSVTWSEEDQVRHAVDLLEKWEPVEIDDAIALLSNHYPHEKIKKYAVDILAKADDQELQIYLLQLVQALQYEAQLDAKHQHVSNFIALRACRNPTLGNFFFWYVSVESPGNSYYEVLKDKFSAARSAGDREASERQLWLVNQISNIQSQLKIMNATKQKKIEKLRQMVSPGGEYGFLSSFPPVRLVFEPTVNVTGIDPESCHMFSSNKAPIAFTFKTLNKEPPGYRVIFKNGDDLRQDQLVIQMVTLMDNLLKKENLDLKLTPYRVLATSTANGFIQCINAKSLTDVIDENNGDIHKWLKQFHPDPAGPYGISSEVIDTFVKSCAGYSVITHILGIGDRHLENLMLTREGNLFHIDFGYILGNEPPFKPLPPPMKLCKEMVNGMGGMGSTHFGQFRQYCVESYNILRKSANLIISLFSLMTNANIHDIALDPEKSILRLQEKFRLEMNDEEASQTMLMLIDVSVKALFPAILDSLHGFLMYWRS
ncbi:atypical PIKK PI3K protein kinase [Pelomyxa schiedti]|nr:atypical PIKK PI3K protein kinase [Pelomyxa schiedti]